MGLTFFIRPQRLLLSVVSMAALLAQADERVLSDQELQAQAQTPFEIKFSVISKDIAGTSSKNLQHLQVLLERHRDLLKYRPEAREKLPAVDDRIIVKHSTSLKGALAILNSESFFSTDELVRRGILKVSAKQGSMTEAGLDGKIGEQDAIFFAIQDKDQAQLFGPVAFEFDKDRILEEGYFSTFPYGTGSPFKFGFAKSYDQAAPLYRKFVFQGKQAYLTLLEFSIAHELWRSSQNLESLAQQANTHPLPSQAKNDFASFFGQSFPSEALNMDQEMSLADYFSPAANSTLAYLKSYKGFPVEVPGNPPLLTDPNWFWELKVPRALSFDFVTAVQFPKSIPVMKDEQKVLVSSDGLKAAIEAYAAKRGRTYILKHLPQDIERYEFSKQ